MKTVYKYPIKLELMQAIEMPAGAVFLHVAKQGDTICAWFEVPVDRVMPSGHLVKRHFEIAETGEWVPDPLVYLGTVIDGNFVWHLYEVI